MTRTDMAYGKKRDTRKFTHWHRSVLSELSFVDGLSIAKVLGPVGAN